MATVQARPLRWARSPFYFNSAAHIIRIGRDRATTLGEFGEILKRCADEAIFQHTFQTLEEHHYVQEGFTNDFAQWSFSACNEVGLGSLADRLNRIDIYTSTLQDVRRKILKIVESAV